MVVISPSACFGEGKGIGFAWRDVFLGVKFWIVGVSGMRVGSRPEVTGAFIYESDSIADVNFYAGGGEAVGSILNSYGFGSYGLSGSGILANKGRNFRGIYKFVFWSLCFV